MDSIAAVVLVHSHPVIRRALESVLGSAPDLYLATVMDHADALDVSMFTRRPTILVIGTDDARALGRVRLQSWAGSTELRLIAISETLRNDEILALCRLTVLDALITWEEPLDTVVDIVRRLVRGEAVLGDIIGRGRVVSRLLKAASTSEPPDLDADALLSPLTSTDCAVLGRIIAQGNRSRVAAALGISPIRLYWREHYAYRHLDIQNADLALAYALARGFLAPNYTLAPSVAEVG